MRILHTSDWHLGRRLENINRIDEQREFIEQLCDIVKGERIDLVLVAGDIFDSYNPSAAAEELFYHALDRLNAGGERAVVVIAGNHDNPERLCASNPLAAKRGIILLGYPDSCAAADSGGGKIKVTDSGPGWLEVGVSRCYQSAVVLTLPYPSEARLERLLSKDADEARLQRAYSERVGSIMAGLAGKYRKDTVNLAVSHIFISGGRESESERTLQVGGALTVQPEVLPARAHFTALGHLHRSQRIKDAPCPACYSGSPLAYSFSESDYAKAVYIIDAVPGKPADIREIYLSCGKPLRRWIAAEGIDQALKWGSEGKDKYAWIDLEIHTDRPITVEEQKALRELNPGILNIRPVIKRQDLTAAGYENRETKKIDQLFKDFYLHKTKTEISEELMGVFLDVLNGDDGSERRDTGEVTGYETQVP